MSLYFVHMAFASQKQTKYNFVDCDSLNGLYVDWVHQFFCSKQDYDVTDLHNNASEFDVE